MERADGWRMVADHDQPQTAVQVACMSTYQILQNPVREAIYRRGWEDQAANFLRMLNEPRYSAPQQPLLPPRQPPQNSPANQSWQQAAAMTMRWPSPTTPIEPVPELNASGAPPKPVVKQMTKQQQARKRRNLMKLKDKIKAKKQLARQQRARQQLGQPAPTADPEAASFVPAITQEQLNHRLGPQTLADNTWITRFSYLFAPWLPHNNY